MTALTASGRQEPAFSSEDAGTVEVLGFLALEREAEGVARICKHLIAPMPVLPG